MVLEARRPRTSVHLPSPDHPRESGMFGCRRLPEAGGTGVAARSGADGAAECVAVDATNSGEAPGPGTSRSPKDWRIEISCWILQSRLSPERVGGASLVTDA